MGTLRGLSPTLLAVDEAHALPHWGRSFRPAFLALADAAEDLGRPPVAALTATADPRTRVEIGELLGLRDPVVVVRGSTAELHLEVVRVERAQDELRELGRLLLPGVNSAPPPLDGKGIVYTRTTRAARDTARWLAERGVAADHYHGRRAAKDRKRCRTGSRPAPSGWSRRRTRSAWASTSRTCGSCSTATSPATWRRTGRRRGGRAGTARRRGAR